MTAPEPTPTAEHIDAVARAINAGGWRGTADAVRILTSTDPAAHAAIAESLPAEVMLAALVRAGVLTEERAPIARHGGIHHWQQRWDGQHTHEGRRFVTPWEVAP